MTHFTPPLNKVVTSSKAQSEPRIVQPSDAAIRNILSFSKALKVQSSRFIPEIVAVNN